MIPLVHYIHVTMFPCVVNQQIEAIYKYKGNFNASLAKEFHSSYDSRLVFLVGWHQNQSDEESVHLISTFKEIIKAKET